MLRAKVGFVSLGCPKNLVDTERMMALLAEQGAVLTGDQDSSDIVVVNTCGFLESAKQESLDTIGEFVQLKDSGKIKGVVVAGCMTERYLALMSEKYPTVDAFVRVGDFSKIVEVVKDIESGDLISLQQRRNLIGEVTPLQGHSELPDFVERIPSKRPFAYVKIAEGCNRVCSFCIIPSLRGKLHSRSIEGIISEVSQIAESGTHEVILIAQDLTSYGKDRADGANLLKLLQGIEKIPGIDWVRLMYNYPRFFTSDLIDFLASSTKFARYLDIPFQHASNRILKAMKRPETAEEIKALIGELRRKIPDLALRTTMMVGFPGESEEDFEDLVRFVEWAEFDNLGAFTYFREPNTPSFQLEDQISDEVKLDRYAELMKVQRRIQKKRLKSRIGSTESVLVDGFAEKTKQGLVYRGRHHGQAPEIDGVTYILSESPLEIGEIYSVEIGKIVGDYDLLGESIDRPEYAEVAQRLDGTCELRWSSLGWRAT